MKMFVQIHSPYDATIGFTITVMQLTDAGAFSCQALNDSTGNENHFILDFNCELNNSIVFATPTTNHSNGVIINSTTTPVSNTSSMWILSKTKRQGD